METLVWLALCLAVPIGLAYRRTDLATSTLVLGALLVIYTAVGSTGAVFKALLWIGYAALASLSAEGWRRGQVPRRPIGVPNSLGPAELLLHYGTDEQKQYWLPRLASGEEVPCFALTSPRVGSDATAIVDHGVVVRGTYEGREIVGIRLNWDKRYITLA